MSERVKNIRGWIDDDCGRAGVVLADAADALEKAERDEAEVRSIMALRSLPDQVRALFDAFATRLNER